MPTGANRWTPITRFPLTKRMNDRFPTAGRKRTWAKSEIVNEALCGKMALGKASSKGRGTDNSQMTFSIAFHPTSIGNLQSISSTYGQELACFRPRLMIF